jgi:hypothetical protein
MVLESRVAFDGRTANVAAALPKTHQLSAKCPVSEAGEESLSKPRFAEPLLRCNRGLAKKTTLRAEWTSDDGTSERFFDYVTLSHLRQGRQWGTLSFCVLKTTTKNCPIPVRLRGWVRMPFRGPILRGFACPEGLGRLRRFRGAGSLCDHLNGV